MRGRYAAVVAVACAAMAWGQPKSAIEFYDTTGNQATARIGWSGGVNGRFYLSAPVGRELLSVGDSGLAVEGEVRATRFRGTVTTSEIADKTIQDSDIADSANIAGLKIHPDFWDKNIRTMGGIDIVVPSSTGGGATYRWAATLYKQGVFFFDQLVLAKSGDTIATLRSGAAILPGQLKARSVTTDTLNAGYVVPPPSDLRLKRSVTPLPDCLARLELMEGVSYDFRCEEFPGRCLPHGHQVGLIAQDVEKAVPEAVSEDADGYKGVDYSRLVPVLVNAIKEQQSEIEELRQSVKLLREEAHLTE